MPTLDRSRTALLVMDYQTPIVAMVAEEGPLLLKHAQAVIAQARAAQVQIIYIVVGFRPGYPEMSPRNPTFARISAGGGFLDTTGGDIAKEVQPKPGDIVVAKHRVGAFFGTDLEIILRSKNIDTLMLMGISTSGVVLSTVRHASDADYQLIVVKDACADRDPEVHRVLIEKVFAGRATIVSAAEAAEALGAAK